MKVDDERAPRADLGRRQVMTIGAGVGLSGFGATLAGASARSKTTHSEPPVFFSPTPRPELHTGPLSIGSLIFPRLDQIDFTGPFEVFARIPDSQVQVVAKTLDPVKDVKGLTLSPTTTIAEAPLFDLLHVAGGLGQQQVMDDPEVVGFIRRHADAGKLVFSVCTGALLCGAAGLLKGRYATTHWAAMSLLKFYGAKPVQARVVVDGQYVSAAGVTAGLDGALVVASLLRGTAVAEEIQLDIEYAPEPVFHSGTPDQASDAVKAVFFQRYGANKEDREREALRFAKRLGISIAAGD